MKTVLELRQYFESDLLPELKELEQVRKQQVQRQIFILLAVFISVTIAIILILPILLLFFLAIFLVFYFIFFGDRRRRFDLKKAYKETIVKKLIAFVQPGLVYTPFQYITRTVFDESKIFITAPDIYNGEDQVQGMIGNTAIEFSELHTQDRTTDSKGRIHYTTIFKGILFIADFNKHFEAETYILSDFSERFLGVFGKWFQNINILRPELIQLGNPEFEKYFAVYTTDPVEARNILTPHFMELILTFRKKTNTNIQFALKNSKLFMAVPMRDNLFEVSLYKTILKFDDIEEYFNELNFCISVVSDLHLNTRIWTKV